MMIPVIDQPQRGQGYPHSHASYGQQRHYLPPQKGNGPPEPQKGEWISALTVPINCPPGLEYLTAIQELLVHHKVELFEDNDCCTRNCCGPMRPFNMRILDHTQREVIHFYRLLRCPGCCCWGCCCLQGPFCRVSCCGDVEFRLLSKDGSTQVGQITKQWSGLIREAFTDADNFSISFPIDLDVNMKAVLLGACFLIDFMFYEKNKN